MLAVIDGARHSLSIENEEMASTAVTSAIVAAAERGVKVEITMTADSYYDSDLDRIVRAGGHVHLYENGSRDLYIHAKTTIADAGLLTGGLTSAVSTSRARPWTATGSSASSRATPASWTS